MENFNFFDIALVALTLMLGLKGLLRGFTKEFFGLVGIIGGVFFASRISGEIGNTISGIIAIENDATKSLLGFVLGFVAIWAVAYALGIVVSKISSMSGLGVIDRVFGFVFGAAKIFFIFAIIIYALSKVDAIKTKLDEKLADSAMYPILQDVGNAIIQLDTDGFTQKIEKNIENTVDDVKEGISEDITENIKESVEEATEAVSETISENTEAVKIEIDKQLEK